VSTPDKDDENPPTFSDLFSKLPEDTRLRTLSRLFSSYLVSSHALQIPDDLLYHAANAMLQLRQNKCTNVLYNLAKGMGTLREDKTDSRFPIKCMPMSLVEYAASYFASDDLQEVMFQGKAVIISFPCRYLVLQITDHGSKPCTANLGRSGRNYFGDQYGV